MDKRFKSVLSVLLSLTLVLSLFSGCKQTAPEKGVSDLEQDSDYVYEGQEYTDPISVSAYLYEWNELPPNYITKSEAQKKGWVSNKGNLWEVAPGMSIGGDKFGNREGLLPKGEEYRECDVNYQGGYRTGERLVYSIDDYDIYYTDDHYESFSQVYDCDKGYVWEEEYDEAG